MKNFKIYKILFNKNTIIQKEQDLGNNNMRFTADKNLNEFKKSSDE